MSEPKFMKGPWQVVDIAPEDTDWDSRFEVWAGVPSEDAEDENGIPCAGLITSHVCGEANAHLIAASPDLYAAAERLAKGLDNLIGLGVIHKNYADEASDLSDAAHEALSKARGEPQ